MLAPLAGLRVLELGGDVSLAFAARLLADMGAEVLRPEPREDPLRAAPPLLEGGDSALFIYLNAGKRLAAAGVAPGRDAGLILALAGHPALPARDDPARPPVVVLSPHGLCGPRAGRPGNAFTTQHGGGYAWHQASPVSDPETAPPLGCPDREAAMLVGLIAANAALAALAEPAGGPAPWIDLSSEDVFAWMLVDALAEYHDGVLSPGRKRQPGKEITIAGGLIWLLPCADGTIVVSPREDHQWARWVALMGEPDWAREAALCGTRAARTSNAAELGRLMREWSAGVSARPVFEQAQAARVACFPVSTAPELLANRQLAARDFFRALALPEGALPMPGLPFAMRDSAGAGFTRGAAVAR
ncbi:MAG: CoA transferase, partial [Rhodospirillales bacterium]|nr:CoA transferase [Rhodospirillales bacterium]